MADIQQLYAITWNAGWGELIATLIRAVLVILPVILLMAIYTWMERRQASFMQDRIGPTRANIPIAGKNITLWGLVHIAADGLKFSFKEDVVPNKVHRFLFALAPILSLAPVVIVFVVIPFGGYFAYHQWDQVVTAETVRLAAEQGRSFRLQATNLDIGLLLVFAFSGLGVFGASLAGYGSHNKWALIGGLRAAAQMVSYEVTLGLTVVGALLLYGTLEPMAIVQWQGPNPSKWGLVIQPIGALLFLAASIAESKRIPFDLPEGESEIIGFNLEYSGMRWGIFFMGEYMELVFVGAMFTTLFLGGFNVPWLYADGFHFGGAHLALPHLAVVLLQMLAFWMKVVAIGFLQVAIRWTLPRLRYDQLMKLGWVGMLPVSLANVMITAVLLLVYKKLGWKIENFWIASVAMLLLTFACVTMLPHSGAAAGDESHSESH
ncbi:MAG: complex I subunit 1 family protein [bacterium]